MVVVDALLMGEKVAAQGVTANSQPGKLAGSTRGRGSGREKILSVGWEASAGSPFWALSGESVRFANCDVRSHVKKERRS